MITYRRVNLAVAFFAALAYLDYSAAAQNCEPRWTPGLFDEIPGLSGPCKTGVIFDDGAGSALFVGGMFVFAGTEHVNRVAKWDGILWNAVGSGFNSTVEALTLFNDGSDERLYAAGFFTVSGTATVNRVARWN